MQRRGRQPSPVEAENPLSTIRIFHTVTLWMILKKKIGTPIADATY
jgi:hypothetical protein